MNDQANTHSITRGDTYVGFMRQSQGGMSKTAMIMIVTVIMLLVAAIAVSVILVAQQKPSTAPVPVAYSSTIQTTTYTETVVITEPEMTVSKTKTHTTNHKKPHHKTTTHHKTTKHRTTTHTKETHRITHLKTITKEITFTVTSIVGSSSANHIPVVTITSVPITTVTSTLATTKAAALSSVNITVIPPATVSQSIANQYYHPPMKNLKIVTSMHCSCGPFLNQTVDSILEASFWSKRCLEELWDFAGESPSDLSALPKNLGNTSPSDIASYMGLLRQYGFWCSKPQGSSKHIE